MKLQDCINIVQQLLKTKVKYSDPKLQHQYEKGLLIGLIAKQMTTDPSLVQEIKKIIKK